MTTLEVDRVKACDEALADRRLSSEQWKRRMSLLEARAVHNLRGGQTGAAAADLDAAARVGDAYQAGALPGDRLFYQRSSGLGLEMLRAATARVSGNSLESQRDWGRVSAARPFAPHVQEVAFRNLLSADAPREAVLPVAARLQRLGLERAQLVVAGLFDRGFEQEAIALQRTLPNLLANPEQPGSSLDPASFSFFDRGVEVSEVGRLAYHLAAAGDSSGATAALTDARQRAAVWVADMPTAGRWAKILSGTELTPDEARTKVDRTLAFWTHMTEARIALEKHNPVDVTALMFDNASVAIESRDLLLAALRSRPTASGDDEVRARVDLITLKLEERRGLNLDPALVFASVPPAESSSDVDAFRLRGQPPLGTSIGFASGTHPDRGITNVTISSDRTGPDTMLEMLLLRVAAIAKDRGQGGFVAEGLKGYSRVWSNSGKHQSEDATVTVRFVNDPTADPRALSARALLTTLGPIYASK
jgi:hypothetical protein